MDALGRQMIFIGSGFDPVTRKDKSYRQVIHIDSERKHSFEWFEPNSDGREVKLFEVLYTRKD